MIELRISNELTCLIREYCLIWQLISIGKLDKHMRRDRVSHRVLSIKTYRDNQKTKIETHKEKREPKANTTLVTFDKLYLSFIGVRDPNDHACTSTMRIDELSC